MPRPLYLGIAVVIVCVLAGFWFVGWPALQAAVQPSPEAAASSHESAPLWTPVTMSALPEERSAVDQLIRDSHIAYYRIRYPNQTPGCSMTRASFAAHR